MSIEGELVLESTKIETVIFILLAVDYVFDLTYQEKMIFFCFYSRKNNKNFKKSKASVAAVHVSRLCRVFNDLKYVTMELWTNANKLWTK